MSRSVLTLNAGSSSIKFSLYQLVHGTDSSIPPLPLMSGQIDGIGTNPHIKASDGEGNRIDDGDIPLAGDPETQHHQALEFLMTWLHRHAIGGQIVAVGHRVVHGGERYSRPMKLDSNIIEHLTRLIPLAPLHQPHNLDGINALCTLMPEVPQVACFDTAFHRTQPGVAQMFALPRWITGEGVKRYGFHGLSYEYIARVLPQHTARAEGRVIVAHLGNGASMAGLVNRQSQVSTMGFTAVEGLMMGTRTGSLDPGVMLYLMETKGMDVKALTKLLYKESGLLGVSGVSSDMRALLASDKPEAKEAVDLFCYRISREIGSLAAAIGGLDALVFTGGIGEHAAEVRRRVCLQAAWLGVDLDETANADHAVRVSSARSMVDVLVIPTNEEWMIARHTATLLNL
ncbi:MAG: acetate/propionate family kinase [Rhodocyclaceae bacterium]|nr:acetate/propionate family kinase [Rhodocyclaceae bacterium]